MTITNITSEALASSFKLSSSTTTLFFLSFKTEVLALWTWAMSTEVNCTYRCLFWCYVRWLECPHHHQQRHGGHRPYHRGCHRHHHCRHRHDNIISILIVSNANAENNLNDIGQYTYKNHFCWFLHHHHRRHHHTFASRSGATPWLMQIVKAWKLGLMTGVFCGEFPIVMVSFQDLGNGGWWSMIFKWYAMNLKRWRWIGVLVTSY